jgi:hypothetical protein
MSDPSFNLLQLERRPNWYDHLDKVEAAMAEDSRICYARFDAGWEGDEGGWYSPDGIHESSWEEEGWPFPEDADFASWFCSAYHYEATDAGLDPSTLNPYPKAPLSRQHLYARPDGSPPTDQ